MNRLVALILFYLTPSTVFALECNICGEGNVMTLERGVVQFEYEGTKYKNSCLLWQQNKLVSEKWCLENMLQHTKNICGCMRPDGIFLKDVPDPTVSPAPTPAAPNGVAGGSGGNVAPVAGRQDPDEEKSASTLETATMMMTVLLLSVHVVFM